MESEFSIRGNIVDIPGRQIFFGELIILAGKIKAVRKISVVSDQSPFIIPGLIDAHVHIESSMLIPSEFARLAVLHGTTATVSDPHEIANVLGMEGVKYMLHNAAKTPFKFHFGAPSCIPATSFETAGAEFNTEEVVELLERPDIYYLSEMMNFPGVLNGDNEVLAKLAAAHRAGKPADGHAPGLRGNDAKKYADAGLSTDHECFTAEEAGEKLACGMKILIREGSAAKNFDALVGLLHEHYEHMMFCSDDKHPDSLVAGHINGLCARAVAAGVDVFKVLQAACINPVIHYKMRCGLLRTGDAADIVVLENLVDFKVLQTYIDGIIVADKGETLIGSVVAGEVNKFDCLPLHESALKIAASASHKEVHVIEALDGQLITNKLLVAATIMNNEVVADPAHDILKIVVINRYFTAPPAISFIKNFGLRHGAIASSVAHDSHNIVAVGVNDEGICKAVNLIIASRGGISALSDDTQMLLSLPVAGLMSAKDGFEVAAEYTAIDNFAKRILGSSLSAPFMTLSFMALLVIPHLKLSDKGLFDGDNFSFII